ncbi:MAG: AAA family ATPase [Bacteroidia bacterium]|nr:AAA family ATPase [Bacteroidia bacterium]
MEQEEVRDLREALRQSPDNIPLRRYLAETLVRLGRKAEAEEEYRIALQMAPGDMALNLGLAQVFYDQGKHTEGLVLVEALLEADRPHPRAWLLYARLLLTQQQGAEARTAYEKALIADPGLADIVLEAELNRQAPREADKVRLHAQPGSDDDEEAYVSVERPGITFEAVGGMESLKDEIRLKIIHPLRHPEVYKAYGKKIGGGILLYGPPGCGKTYLARATAGETQSGFIPVGINEILDMYLGQSERNLHAIFELARQHKPCVLFFDEVDALGANRSDMRQSAGRHLINQFLAEMDGVDSDNEGVLILAATNAPWHLDPAFRRPGRFDRILFVPPPDEASRREILEILLRDKPQEGLDLPLIARQTADFSGADLRALVELAIEAKISEALKQGIPTPITTRDLQAALKKCRPSTREWFLTAKNYALFANEAGLYDDILKYLNIKR